MAIPRGAVVANLYNLLPRAFQGSSFTALHAARTSAVSWSPILPSASITIPAISLNIPGAILEIWEGILRAVPKKKTSHMKKRHRQLAGKALKDVKSLVQCPACGKPKKAHMLCPYCVAGESLSVYLLPCCVTDALKKLVVAALHRQKRREE
jgi:large subunit ribosomal protein L32